MFFLTQNGVSISPVLDYSNMNNFILGYSKALKNLKEKDFLPSCAVYAEYLKKASQIFNLSINECRNRFGCFTENQWKMILI